jgi:hypothetical protein
MSKIIALVLLLTLTPGYALWIVAAALLPGACLLVEEVTVWREGRGMRAGLGMRARMA